MLKPLAVAALLTAGSLAALPAHAQPRATDWGSYLGVAIGDSDLDTSLKIFGGQSVTPQWGWEASYIDFGSKTIRTTTTEAWALGGSLVGKLPLSPQVSAFGKVGVYYVDSEVRAPTFTVSDTSLELGAGVGVRFTVSPQVSLRVEVETIGGEGGDLISLGAQFRF